MTKTPQDYKDQPFLYDVSQQVDPIDSVITQILRSEEKMNRFLKDPVGILQDLELLPASNDKIKDRSNKIFFLCLKNKKIIGLIQQLDADIPQLTENFKQELDDKLKQDALKYPLEYDMKVVQSLLKTEQLRQIYQIFLNELNDKKILINEYTTQQLDDYIDQMLSTISSGKSITKIQPLEQWDENYGVGTGYGVGEAAIGVLAGVAVVVQAVVAGTAAVIAAAAVLGEPYSPFGSDFVKLTDEDKQVLNRIELLTSVFTFSNELIQAIENYEIE